MHFVTVYNYSEFRKVLINLELLYRNRERESERTRESACERRVYRGGLPIIDIRIGKTVIQNLVEVCVAFSLYKP